MNPTDENNKGYILHYGAWFGRPDLDKGKFPVVSPHDKDVVLKRIETKTIQQWVHEDLLVCKNFPPACRPRHVRLRLAMASMATMRRHVGEGKGSDHVCHVFLWAMVIGLLGPLFVRHCIVCTTKEQKELMEKASKITAAAKAEVQKVHEDLRKVRSMANAFDQVLRCLWRCTLWCLSLPWRPIDYVGKWWSSSLDFAYPVTTFKLFIVALLHIELQGYMAPEGSILATPELIGYVRRFPFVETERENHEGWLVPHLSPLLTPGLNEHTADAWSQYLFDLRGRLLVAWFFYILLPTSDCFTRVVSGSCYVYGALAYSYLGLIGLMYNLSHSVQGGLLFIAFSVLAVPFMPTNPRASKWLRMFLVINLLVPVYLFSGVNKLRYGGLMANMTGSWITEYVKMEQHTRSSLPWLNGLIISSSPLLAENVPWMCTCLSWGNLIVEVFLPIIVMNTTHAGPLVGFFIWLYAFGILSFHLGVFMLMGPNFSRQALLAVLATDPLAMIAFTYRCSLKIHAMLRGYTKVKTEQPRSFLSVEDAAAPGTASSDAAESPSEAPKVAAETMTPMTGGDRIRAIIAFVMLAGWWWSQLWSDVDRFIGTWGKRWHHNMYFPFPEFSMYGSVIQPDYEMSFMILVVILACFIGKMFNDLGQLSVKRRD